MSGLDIDQVCNDPRSVGCVRYSPARSYGLQVNSTFLDQQLGTDTYRSPVALEVITFPVRFVLFTPSNDPGGYTFNHEMHHLVDSFNLVRNLEDRMARNIRARVMGTRRLAAANPQLRHALLSQATLYEIVNQEDTRFSNVFAQEFVARGEQLHAQEADAGGLPAYRIPGNWTDVRRVTPTGGGTGSFTTRPC